MGLKEIILKWAGKEDFKLDNRISKTYYAKLLFRYGMMVVRGKTFSLGNKSIKNSVFVGKKVKVLEKRRLSIGEKTRIHDNTYIDALSFDGISIGDYVVLGRNTRIECTGSLERIGKGLVIGDRTTFGNDCFFGAAGGIVIGDDVVAGQYIRFHSENHNYIDMEKLIREQGVTHKGIRVGNNCWIGSGAVFLDGSALGNGCVVASNAVVTKQYPDNSVIGGVPAKLIKYRGDKGENRISDTEL